MGMEKILSAYNNLNEALKNNKVNKALVMDLADGLQSETGSTYKVRPFQFSEEMTEVGLLQAEALSEYAKRTIESLNHKYSKEVFNKSKNIVMNFVKMYRDRLRDYDANTEIVEKMKNYFENQAVADYAISSDGSILESKSENKYIFRFHKWNVEVFTESLSLIENNDSLSKMLEDITNFEDSSPYSPFLNLIMNLLNIIDSTVKSQNYYSSNDSKFLVVGKPVYVVDIIDGIVNNALLEAFEGILSDMLQRFYEAYGNQESINGLSRADEISKDKEKVIESLDTPTKLLNCFNDEYGVIAFTFLLKLIYSKKKPV